MWSEKHTQGIDKLYAELKTELAQASSMKDKLNDMGWAYGPPPSKIAEDSPASVVQRALARWAMIEITKARL